MSIPLGKSGSLELHKLKREDQGGKIEAEPEADKVDIDLSSGFPVIRAKSASKGLSAVEAVKADREAKIDR